MGGTKKKKLGGRELITEVLRWLDGELVEAGEIFEMWARHRKHRLDPEHKLAEERYQKERALRSRLNYLRRKGLIKTKKIEDGLLYGLTNSGQIELLKRLVRERPKLPRGQICVVAYDVPIGAGKGRDALRYFLKRIGFTQVQKSVWQTEKDVTEEVFSFVKKARIRKWVQVFLGRRLD